MKKLLAKKKIVRSPLFWGIFSTLAYFVLFFLFLGWFGNHPFKLLDLNEAGDFFAGAFAPLAFIWLVVAVFLQKQELGAQRETLEQQMEELRLSREELKLNRKILADQGIELKKQSGSLAQQSLALEESGKIRKISTKIEELIRNLTPELRKVNWAYTSDMTRSGYSSYNDPVPGMLAKDQFAEAARQIRYPIEKIIEKVGYGYLGFGSFESMEKDIENIMQELEQSDEIKAEFSAYELDELYSLIKQIAEIEREFRKK